MSDNLLYFIPIIAKALQKPDIKNALRDAFREIKKKGAQKRFAEGFRNFELFMNAVYCRHEAVTDDYIHELIAELATGTFEGTDQEIKTLLDLINSHPQWKAEYQAFCRMEAHEDLMRDFPVIEVLSERGLVSEITFTKVSGCESIDNIVPGNYKLKLVNTGWIIWEGQFTTEELIWPEGKSLSLAAETKDAQIPPTGRKVLLDGCLIIRTYAGIENGRIEIELTGQEGGF